jgi:hypothetical protein
MHDRSILIWASSLMGFASLLHLARVLARWKLEIESWNVPIWLSIFVFLFAGFLSYKLFVISKKSS